MRKNADEKPTTEERRDDCRRKTIRLAAFAVVETRTDKHTGDAPEFWGLRRTWQWPPDKIRTSHGRTESYRIAAYYGTCHDYL